MNIQSQTISSAAPARLPPRARLPMPAFAQAKPKVVVIGGGPGGATAREICRQGFQRRDRCHAGRAAAKQFVTCFHSNLYLGGFRDFESITHSYAALAKKHGVKLAHASGGRRSTATRRPCGSPTARSLPTTAWWSRRAST